MLKFVFKELKNNRRFTFLFIINLSLGLSGFTALDIFKYSLDEALQKQSKAILGGDLSVSSRRPLNSQEQKQVESFFKDSAFEKTKALRMYAMVLGAKTASRLSLVTALEPAYPFYGAFLLQQKSPVKDLHKTPSVWVHPELLDSLNVKIGDFLQLGQAKFRITDVVEEEPIGPNPGMLAPKIYISYKYLSSAGLLSQASLAWHSYIYKIPGADLAQLKNKAQKIFSSLSDPHIRVHTHENAGENFARLFKYLSDFLALTALTALFLTCVGLSFLLNSWLKSKVREMAVLNVLGLNWFRVFLMYLFQALILGVLGFTASLFFGGALFLILKPVLLAILPFEIDFHILALGKSFLLALLTPVIISLPLLANLYKIKPSLWLRGKRQTPPGLLWLSYLPLIFVLWILAVGLSHSFSTGTLFTVLFLSAGFLLFCLARAGLYALKIKPSFLILRWAFRDLARRPTAVISCFLCLSLGLLLLNIIPQLEKSLLLEIKNPEQSSLPSFFLFDIQEEQKEKLKTILRGQGLKDIELKPLVRARLLSVNGEGFDKGLGPGADFKNKDKQREMHFRNRGFNLSYRAGLYDTEKTVKGQDFYEGVLTKKGVIRGSAEDAENKLPYISLENRFARRLGFKINDVLEFLVQGEKVKGVVKNIRRVKWHTFQPNFFVLFQPGVLEDFSKTYLSALPSLSLEKAQAVQTAVVPALPNISFVNIQRTAKKLLSLSEQISKALQLMSLLCLLAGFVVLYSINTHQVNNRKKDMALFKMLGLSAGKMHKLFLYQMIVIAFFAGLFGMVLSLGVSYILSAVFFYSAWSFSLVLPLALIAGSVLLSCVISYLSTARAVLTPVRTLFSS